MVDAPRLGPPDADSRRTQFRQLAAAAPQETSGGPTRKLV
jgi:hypothetical protein